MASEPKWILKAPLFNYLLDELREALPEASTTFVFTSREPANVVPSTCGMAEVLASVQMRYDDAKVNLHRLGSGVSKRMQAYADAQLDFCAKPPARLRKPPLTLKYKEVLSDPMVAVRKVYEHAGRKLDVEVEDAMKEHLAQNGQHKEGRPNYSLATFGLDKMDLAQRFAKYTALVSDEWVKVA